LRADRRQHPPAASRRTAAAPRRPHARLLGRSRVRRAGTAPTSACRRRCARR
jgi:hypothetical protein